MTVPVYGLPPLLHAGLWVALVPPPLKESRWHQVAAASSAGGAGQLVALADVQDIAAADALVGKLVLANLADLPGDLALHDVDTLLGRQVCDASYGDLGSITEVMRGSAQDVWVIEGPYGEVLLPVVDEFIVAFGADGPIEVRVPEGTIRAEGE